MGGKGSGRGYGLFNNKTLDDCCDLDINQMMQTGAVQEQSFKSGIWTWFDGETGRATSKIGYICDTTSEHDSYLELFYQCANNGENVNYRVKVIRTYPPYGGVRFWFICPVTGKRVGKLYLMPSDNRFLSRHAGNLCYETQVLDPIYRAMNRKWKLMDKVDGRNYPERPKGMHHRTFENIVAKFRAQNHVVMRMIAEELGIS